MIDDETLITGLIRKNFRLHPGRVSLGCITLRKKDDFNGLKEELLDTKPTFIPGTTIRYYGIILVR